MLLKNYRNKTDRFLEENALLKVIILIMLITNICLAYFLISSADTKKIVFLPPKVISKEFEATTNTLSKTYLEEVGNYISLNLFSVSQELANDNFENILALVKPEAYQKTKTELVLQYEYLKNNGISRTFFINNITTDKKSIRVTGILKDMSGDIIISSKKTTLNIYYEVENSRFYITKLAISDSY